MAHFCLSTGQTPAVYECLTRLERQAFYDLLDDQQRR